MELSESGLGWVYEPLTQRERNILTHLANNRSSPEIARLETLAHSSVKWYIHQIYAKLGVSLRSDAITRARDLGLLGLEPPHPNNALIPKNNLPRQLTSFIGRAAEIPQLLALVQRLPLVTLTGSGGTGKTRLALQVAERSVPIFSDGVWLISLAPLSDPEMVALVIAAALGMREIPLIGVIPALNQFIGPKHLLLVLDNCEHLVGAAAALSTELLQACPHLHILATSRELLGINGEKTFRCPPLLSPDPISHPTISDLAQSEAVRLFVERAQHASADFRLTETNAPLVARVCQRLDGIPLAIELAAARVRLLSIEQIAARLDNVFHLLTGSGHAVLARHQTLKALVDWSYDLLSEPERCLLCRLSVFAGSWTLAAAEEVCGCPVSEVSIPSQEILELLGQLVDKSLIEVLNVPAEETRYRMLEMIRQYAHHRLLESGEIEKLREQHLDYYLNLGLQAELHLRAKGSRAWKVRLEAELDNLRDALEWSISGSIEKGLRIAAALQWFWAGTLHRQEGVDWLNRLLAAEASTRFTSILDSTVAIPRKIARGKAINACSYIGLLLGQDGRNMAVEAMNIFQSLGNLCSKDLTYSYYLCKEKGPLECLELFLKIGDPFFICEMRLFLTQIARSQGQLNQAHAYIEESLSLLYQTGDLVGQSSALWELGMLKFLAGNFQQAGADFAASQACCVENGNVEMYPLLFRFYAWIALVQGDVQQAVQHSQAQLAAASQHFIPWLMTDALGFLGWEAFTVGDIDLAVQYCEKALNLTQRPDQSLLATARYVLARVALGRGELAHARACLKAFVTVNYYSWPPVQLGLQLFGILAARQMDHQPAQACRAAALFGAQAGMQACLMNVIPLPERQVFEQALAAVRAALSADDFAAAYAEGQAMTTAQAIQFALDEME